LSSTCGRKKSEKIHDVKSREIVKLGNKKARMWVPGADTMIPIKITPKIILPVWVKSARKYIRSHLICLWSSAGMKNDHCFLGIILGLFQRRLFLK